jgi:nucleoside-diphosphate-sugar epimerase
MKLILITGGAGFIGLHLAKAFVADGFQVHLLDDFSRGKPDLELSAVSSKSGVEVITLDLSVERATNVLGTDYDVIIHLAAILGVANILANSYRALTTNFLLTREALRLACRQKKLHSFVFASTSEVYAGSPNYSTYSNFRLQKIQLYLFHRSTPHPAATCFRSSMERP